MNSTYFDLKVRRAETALVRELEKRDLNSAKNDANAAEKKTPTSAAPARSYDVQIKNYCEFIGSIHVNDVLKIQGDPYPW